MSMTANKDMQPLKDSFAQIRVAAGIVIKHGRFLAAQRPDDKPLAGYWELPGGKVEGDESPEEALCRELAEELGINALKYVLLEVVEHCYAERNFTATIYFFTVDAFEGVPCPRENQNLRWVDPEEAGKLDFLPADAGVIKRLLEAGPGEWPE